MCGRYQRRFGKQRVAEAFALGNLDGLALEIDLVPAPTLLVWEKGLWKARE